MKRVVRNYTDEFVGSKQYQEQQEIYDKLLSATSFDEFYKEQDRLRAEAIIAKVRELYHSRPKIMDNCELKLFDNCLRIIAGRGLASRTYAVPYHLFNKKLVLHSLLRGAKGKVPSWLIGGAPSDKATQILMFFREEDSVDDPLPLPTFKN